MVISKSREEKKDDDEEMRKNIRDNIIFIYELHYLNKLRIQLYNYLKIITLKRMSYHVTAT